MMDSLRTNEIFVSHGNILQLDEYCRLNNKVSSVKHFNFKNSRKRMAVIEDTDDYEVGQNGSQ